MLGNKTESDIYATKSDDEYPLVIEEDGIKYEMPPSIASATFGSTDSGPRKAISLLKTSPTTHDSRLRDRL